MQRSGYSADGRAFHEDTDSDDECTPLHGGHRAKPRRKAHQKPQGSDQIRQAFSKRKKGLVLKSYQLYRLTDAKVFMFVCNDKGSSWAYSTPGFGAPLAPALLKELREMAHVPEQGKFYTEVMPHPPGIANHSEEADDRAIYVNRKEALSVSATATASTILSGGGGVADTACPPPRQALPPGGRRGTPTSSSSGGRLGSTRSQTARAARVTKAEPLSPAKSLQDCQLPPGQDQMQVSGGGCCSMSMDGSMSAMGCGSAVNLGTKAPLSHSQHSHLQHHQHMVEPPTPSGFYNLFASGGGTHASPLSAPGSHSSPGLCGVAALLPAALPQQHGDASGAGVMNGCAAHAGPAPAAAAGADGAAVPPAQRMVQRLSTENAAQLAAMLSRELAKRRPGAGAAVPAPASPACYSQPYSQPQVQLEPMCSGVLGGGNDPFETMQSRLPRLRAHAPGGRGGFESEEVMCHSAPAGAVHPLMGGSSGGSDHGSHMQGAPHHMHPHLFVDEESLLMSGFGGCDSLLYSGGGSGGLRAQPRAGGGYVQGNAPRALFGPASTPSGWPQADSLGRCGSSAHCALTRGSGDAPAEMPTGGCLLLGDQELDDPMLAALLEEDVGLAPPQSAASGRASSDVLDGAAGAGGAPHRMGSPLPDGAPASMGMPRVAAGTHMLHGRSRLGSVSTSPADPMPCTAGTSCGAAPPAAAQPAPAASDGFDLPHLPPLHGGSCAPPCDLKRTQGMVDCIESDGVVGSPLKRNRSAGGPGHPSAAPAPGTLDALLGDMDTDGVMDGDDAVTWAMQAAQNGTVCSGSGRELSLLGGAQLSGSWPVMA